MVRAFQFRICDPLRPPFCAAQERSAEPQFTDARVAQSTAHVPLYLTKALYRLASTISASAATFATS